MVATVFASAQSISNRIQKGADGSEFGGYYFKVVDDKGASVRLVAYPAKYRESGIVTFIVTTDGSIYQHNLGVQTADLAPQVRVLSLEMRRIRQCSRITDPAWCADTRRKQE